MISVVEKRRVTPLISIMLVLLMWAQPSVARAQMPEGDAPERLRVLALGDSYTAGVGGSSWTRHRLGWLRSE